MRRPWRDFTSDNGRSAALAAIALLLCGASPADSERDRPAIKAARSIVAEWALINRAAAEHRVTRLYAVQMRDEARSQLADQLHVMANPRSPASAEIARLLAIPPASDAAVLERGVERLLQIEKRL
jgi:hypothetical protein